MAFIDETGNKYGLLTVIKRVENDKHGKACWLCKCECGNEIVVQGSSLRRGNTKTCGCRRLFNEQNEIGKRYGSLVVESFVGKTAAKKNIWRCRCDCGNYTETTTGHLHSGLVKTCGHHHGGKNIINEVGNTYGKLTVIKKASPPKNSKSTEAFWLCKCECGNETIVSGTNLRNNITKSCGCIKSRGEYNINILLQNNNIKYKSQYIFEDLKYKSFLKYDFAILDDFDNVIRLIEFDGPQHTTGNIWNTEEVNIRDIMKNSYAKENNIPLVRIPYSERDSITLETLFSSKYLINEQ